MDDGQGSSSEQSVDGAVKMQGFSGIAWTASEFVLQSRPNETTACCSIKMSWYLTSSAHRTIGAGFWALLLDSYVMYSCGSSVLKSLPEKEQAHRSISVGNTLFGRKPIMLPL